MVKILVLPDLNGEFAGFESEVETAVGMDVMYLASNDPLHCGVLRSMHLLTRMSAGWTVNSALSCL